MVDPKIWEKLQKEIDRVVANVKNAKTPEETRKAIIELEAAKSVVNAYLFCPEEMERLS